jgi:hypothetical protein
VFCVLGFLRRSWVVVGQQIEVDPVRGAYRLQMLAGSLGGLGAFAYDAGHEKVFRAFEVDDQFEGLVARANHAQMQGDTAVLGASRLKGGDLHAAGEHHLQVLHS